jgi:hypothetical protein
MAWQGKSRAGAQPLTFVPKDFFFRLSARSLPIYLFVCVRARSLAQVYYKVCIKVHRKASERVREAQLKNAMAADSFI